MGIGSARMVQRVGSPPASSHANPDMFSEKILIRVNQMADGDLSLRLFGVAQQLLVRRHFIRGSKHFKILSSSGNCEGL